jgi:hypothetical protein
MNRRGFLKLVGAVTAVPVVAQIGSALPPEARELVIPAGAVVEELTVATTLPQATSGLSEDLWLWQERYKQRVAHEIEAEAYDRITFVVNTAGHARYSIPHFGYEVGGSYELSGPVIGRRVAMSMLDARTLDAEVPWAGRTLNPEGQARELGTIRHEGIAHAVARQIGRQVERDVLAELLTLHRQERAAR